MYSGEPGNTTPGSAPISGYGREFSVGINPSRVFSVARTAVVEVLPQEEAEEDKATVVRRLGTHLPVPVAAETIKSTGSKRVVRLRPRDAILVSIHSRPKRSSFQEEVLREGIPIVLLRRGGERTEGQKRRRRRRVDKRSMFEPKGQIVKCRDTRNAIGQPQGGDRNALQISPAMDS